MTWPLFAVIQLAMLTIGISVAFVLRNRTLKQRYESLLEGLDAAETAVAKANERSSEGAEKLWLRDRVGEIPESESDDIARIQRMVLENELSPTEDFTGKLTTILSSAEAARAAAVEQWSTTRESAAAIAADLISRYPLSHPVISQLHEAYESLDQAFGTSSPALPDPEPVDDADETDITQEVEHLRAANDLLQQFTKDSRDMMTCIQKLEAENANLRQQLGLNESPAAESNPTESEETAA
jgi:hypothetical protein